jgi:hypothetical protein
MHRSPARRGLVRNTAEPSGELTSGDAVAMTDLNGDIIATPERLTDWTFKAVWGS